MANSMSLLVNSISLGHEKIKFRAFKSDVVSKMNKKIWSSYKSKEKRKKIAMNRKMKNSIINGENEKFALQGKMYKNNKKNNCKK